MLLNWPLRQAPFKSSFKTHHKPITFRGQPQAKEAPSRAIPALGFGELVPPTGASTVTIARLHTQLYQKLILSTKEYIAVAVDFTDNRLRASPAK